MTGEHDLCGSSGLESMLFRWDPDATARKAEAFVVSTTRRLKPAPRSTTPDLPDFAGAYSWVGGETTTLRANDAALALARRARAA